MILLIAVPVIVAVVVFIWEYKDDLFTWVGMILTSFGAAFVILLLNVILVAAISTCVPEESLLYREEPAQTIYAFKNTSAVDGRFYLASGTVKEEPCYYYIVETEKGKKLLSVSAEYVYIVEGDDDPSITQYCGYDFKNKALWLFVIPSRDYYIVHIPAGSIAQTYQVQLE